MSDFFDEPESVPRKRAWPAVVATVGVTFVVLCIIAGALVGYGVSHGYYFNSKGEVVAPYEPSDKNARVMVGESGQEYVDGSSDGLMGQPKVTDGGDVTSLFGGSDDGSGDSTEYFAPMPENLADSYDGSYEPVEYNAESMPNNTWVIPDLSQYDGSPVTATVSTGSFSAMPDNGPGYSYGIISSLSEALTSGHGSTVEAGHVNQSANGMLSSWGYLHKARVGMHVYHKDENGQVHEFVIDRVRLLAQGDEFASDHDTWTHEGDKKLQLVTCAGEYIGDDGTNSVGGTFWFPYTHNLVVTASPVSGS